MTEIDLSISNQERALLGLPLIVRITQCCNSECLHNNYKGMYGYLVSISKTKSSIGSIQVQIPGSFNTLVFSKVEILP